MSRPLEQISADIFNKSAELLALFGELKQAQPREYVACVNCSAPIEVGTGIATKRRRFCSDRCRVASSRKQR